MPRVPHDFGYYSLNADHSVTKHDDLMRWAMEFEHSNRRVKLTILAPGIFVSTVFLGLDHSFSDTGPPILFESMSFTDYGEQGCDRYATWDEAVAGHEAMVAELRSTLKARGVKVENGAT